MRAEGDAPALEREGAVRHLVVERGECDGGPDLVCRGRAGQGEPALAPVVGLAAREADVLECT